MVTCDSYPKHFAKQEGKLRIWSVVLYRRKHFYLKTYRWVLIHVSKFCYKQPILQLSCYWVLSSKNFYIVERSSIECQEEASGATKSRLVLILNLIDLDSGACFLDPIQGEIKRNQSKRGLHLTLIRKLLQGAIRWTTIRLQQYEASQSES